MSAVAVEERWLMSDDKTPGRDEKLRDELAQLNLLTGFYERIQSMRVIPFAWEQLCRSGPLAMWEYAAQVLGIGLGVVVAGVVGALFAVPTIAVANAVGKYLLADDPSGPPVGALASDPGMPDQPSGAAADDEADEAIEDTVKTADKDADITK